MGQSLGGAIKSPNLLRRVQKLMDTHPSKVKSCNVRGFTLTVRGSQQLNYEVMKENVDEITDLLDDRRNIEVW